MEKNDRKNNILIDEQNSHNKNPVVFIDKSIDNIKDDLIGIDHYVDSLKEAINQGAHVISINSKYGGGKSSVCNILMKDDKFGKVSKVSLWDVALDNKTLKQQEENNNDTMYKFDVMTFYKSFLFQLSADFHSEEYSRYVSKSLNRNSGSINIFLKSRKLRNCFLCGCISLFIYGLLLGVVEINFPALTKFLDYFHIESINIDFFRYLFLMIGLSFFIYML